ncbi:MAG: glutathione peroxidase [Gemmataceae bacterium]|nr:glutathione peroxidase [Gemmataceae bacterium]
MMKTLFAGIVLGVAGLALAGDKPMSALDFTMKDIDGKEVKLAEKYKGKVVLFVNVASKCGYTKQYKELEALHEQFGGKGLSIVGVPANNFGAQEPGTDSEIKEFCSSKFGVKFDLMSKVSVKGKDICPLYQYLTTKSSPAGDVAWNFEKYLVGKDGTILGHYKSAVKPDSPELVKAIEAALAK